MAQAREQCALKENEILQLQKTLKQNSIKYEEERTKTLHCEKHLSMAEATNQSLEKDIAKQQEQQELKAVEIQELKTQLAGHRENSIKYEEEKVKTSLLERQLALLEASKQKMESEAAKNSKLYGAKDEELVELKRQLEVHSNCILLLYSTKIYIPSPYFTFFRIYLYSYSIIFTFIHTLLYLPF